ncbi:lipase 3-like [Anoplophora glabripennis]|nr:lipase 3-like [Anoplophora glabripennis]
MATERPEYNDKVKISSVYAPSVLLKYMDYPFAVTFSYVVELFQLIYDILGMGVLFPVNDSIALLTKILCSETTYFLQFCTHLLSVIGSHESQLITKEVASLLFSVRPVNIAARQLFHYMQNVKSG